MEIEEYMFKLKISILGDKSVGKTTFLQCIENSFGDLVSSEETDELSLKVYYILREDNLLNRPWPIWTIARCIRFSTGNYQEAWRRVIIRLGIVLGAQRQSSCLIPQENKHLTGLKDSSPRRTVVKFRFLCWLAIK